MTPEDAATKALRLITLQCDGYVDVSGLYPALKFHAITPVNTAPQTTIIDGNT